MAQSNQQLSKQTNDVRALISSPKAMEQFARALPDHITADKFVRVALNAMNRTPKLAKCTSGSLIESLMRCSEAGLEPDGRHAHLIPYGTECTLVIDYKGLVQMVKRSGDVSTIKAEVVYEGDDFDYETCRHVKWGFRRDELKPENPGKLLGAFCRVTMKDGTEHLEQMTKDEIDRIRHRSRSGSSGPWVTDYDEMAKKTVFRRAAKWLPVSAELQETIQKGDSDVRNDIPTRPSGVAAAIESVVSEDPEATVVLGDHTVPYLAAIADATTDSEVLNALEAVDDAEDLSQDEKNAIAEEGSRKISELADAKTVDAG